MSNDNQPHRETVVAGATRRKLLPRKRVAICGVSAIALLGALSPFSGATVEGTEATTGLPVDANGVRLGPLFSVADPGPGFEAGMPMAYSTDTVVDGVTTKRVFVSFKRNADVPAADEVNETFVSDDGGTWYPQLQTGTAGARNMIRLRDGRLAAPYFIPEWSGPQHSSVDITTEVSDDLGETWTTVVGMFTPPLGAAFGDFDRGLRVHRGGIELADGTWIVPGYTRYVGDPHVRSILLQSSDGGQSWSQRSTIVEPTAVQGTNEFEISRTADGRLLAVLRPDGGPENLLQTYSLDDGLTWAPPTPVVGPAGADTGFIQPGLELLTNGAMLLTYGRPDNKLLVSYDGNGDVWEDYLVTFSNPPTMTGPARNHGSSGNTDIVAAEANRALLVGDACANTWGCRQYDENHRIWARYVDVVTPGPGKIDLATKERAGIVHLDGTFVPPDPLFPETRPQGAIDGSNEEFATALLEAPPGTPTYLTVELDREYTIDRVGLMLRRGSTEDADIQLSTDGMNWSAPVVSATDRTDYALRYQNITPQPARYVRVQSPSGGQLTGITELELYAADLHTFENDPVFGLPRGFTDVNNAVVSTNRTGGFQSKRSLQLLDLAVDDSATATRLTTNSATKQASFMWATTDFRNGFIFDVMGEDNGQLTKPWHFNLSPIAGTQDAHLRVYDGSAWQTLGVVSGVGELGVWTPISVDASLTQATVTVGAQAFQTQALWQPADTLSGVRFASAGLAPYGMQFFIDDLEIEDQ